MASDQDLTGLLRMARAYLEPGQPHNHLHQLFLQISKLLNDLKRRKWATVCLSVAESMPRQTMRGTVSRAKGMAYLGAVTTLPTS